MREERRIETAKTAAISTRTRSKSVSSSSPSSIRAPLPPVVDMSSDPSSGQPASVDVIMTAPSTSVPLGRRPSAISLSSLHRAPPPLRLDLSSLRMSADEASLFSGGLSSPVTLAPRSARLSTMNEVPPDLMNAFTTSPTDAIDLTESDTVVTDMTAVNNNVNISLDPALGSSADKPIELDLDMDIDMSMTDLFGDPTGPSPNSANVVVDSLFSPSDGKRTKVGEALQMEIMDAVFPSLGGDLPQSVQVNESLPAPPLSGTAPSPASLLASVNAVSDTPFELLDLSSLSTDFFSGTTGTEDINLMEMEELFNIGDIEQSKK